MSGNSESFSDLRTPCRLIQLFILVSGRQQPHIHHESLHLTEKYLTNCHDSGKELFALHPTAYSPIGETIGDSHCASHAR